MTKLSSAKDAIKQAIDWGYRYRWYLDNDQDNSRNLEFREILEHMVEPLFWQALGKARGWEDNPTVDENYLWWKVYARAWFETQLSGEDEQKFWESLQ